jgi:hypothetical protein
VRLFSSLNLISKQYLRYSDHQKENGLLNNIPSFIGKRRDASRLYENEIQQRS